MGKLNNMRLVLGVLFCCFINLLYSSSYSIAYVQIGNSLPKHAVKTFEQARYFNNSCRIYLLASPNVIHDIKSSRAEHQKYQDLGITLVDVSKIPKTKTHKEFKKRHRLDFKVRDNFWLYTTQRFFYLYDFIKKKNLKNVFHFENDVLLYEDLTSLVPCFEKLLAPLATPFSSYNLGVAAIFYIRNSLGLKNYCRHILQRMTDPKVKTDLQRLRKLTDMFTLASFKKSTNSRGISQLPQIMPEYAQSYKPRKLKYNVENTPLNFLVENFNLFGNRIFDAAGLGIYINGWDPNNNRGTKPGSLHWSTIFDPRKFDFFWGKDEKGRDIPQMSLNKKIYRVVNLHLHSKQLDHFLSFNKSKRAHLDPKLRK